jgi:CubicO group peptidase (beta-lactamase class C family)
MRWVFAAKKFVRIGIAAGIAALLALVPDATALAQNDLPPIAAPTSSVSVSSLPVVRSESQQVTDYARGLVAGMSVQQGVSGVIVIVSQDRVDMAERFGQGLVDLGEDDPVSIGSMGDLFAVVSALQLMQRGAILPDEDIANALGETEPHGIAFGDLLTQRSTGLGLIVPPVVENVTSTPYPEWVAQEIFSPLGMTNSHYDPGDGFLTSPRDLGRFLLALVNEGEIDGGTILLPPTVELMTRTHRSNHPSLPGWTLGFAEMHRNGWRALQRDGTGVFTEARVVIVPEVRIAYFVAVAPGAGPAFWQVLDGLLFDQLLPPRDAESATGAGTVPSEEDAAATVGYYGRVQAESEALFVKAPAETLRVRAAGALLQIGGDENYYQPELGGIWRNSADETPLAFSDGVLQIGEFAYTRVPPLVSAGTYAVLVGAFGFFSLAFAAAGFFAPSLAGHEPTRGRELALGMAGLTAILALAAAALHATV